MAGFRTLIERRPFTREFLVTIVDAVVLPALGAKPAPERRRRAT
jgi:hypothetical protein